MLRAANAELVVKVVDACYSGTLLVKSSESFFSNSKQGFTNLIQIAACLDSQTSLTGNPLSLFTDKFRAAALRKLEGAIYYSDIENALRDEFLDKHQTPHFVSQGTHREVFVEDAKRLDGLRAKVCATSSDAVAIRNVHLVAQPATILEILQKAEMKFAKKETAQAFISRLFERLAKKASSADFADLFRTEIVEHPSFEEPTTRGFIIRVLANEKRPDNFVSVAVPKEHRRRDPFNFASIAAGLFGDPDDAVSHYQLGLNCELEKAQLKITLTPKFVTLKRFVLVVSCAPSLEVCYVMEMLTEHPLMDWGVFDSEGTEVVRRWYKKEWTDPCDSLVDKIFDGLWSVVQESVDLAAQALSQN